MLVFPIRKQIIKVTGPEAPNPLWYSETVEATCEDGDCGLPGETSLSSTATAPTEP